MWRTSKKSLEAKVGIPSKAREDIFRNFYDFSETVFKFRICLNWSFNYLALLPFIWILETLGCPIRKSDFPHQLFFLAGHFSIQAFTRRLYTPHTTEANMCLALIGWHMQSFERETRIWENIVGNLRATSLDILLVRKVENRKQRTLRTPPKM